MKTRSQDAKPIDKSTALTITNNTTNKKKQQQQQAKVKKMKKRLTADEPKKPKKPPTAFFYYLEDFRKTYQAEHPDVKSMRDIGKACGEKWKTMNFEELGTRKTIGTGHQRNRLYELELISDQEKVQYFDMATEKRAEYEKAMATYIKRKESGELSEESDDEYSNLDR